VKCFVGFFSAFASFVVIVLLLRDEGEKRGGMKIGINSDAIWTIF